eukprot:5290383-Amphidinium_carterae.1
MTSLTALLARGCRSLPRDSSSFLGSGERSDMLPRNGQYAVLLANLACCHEHLSMFRLPTVASFKTTEALSSRLPCWKSKDQKKLVVSGCLGFLVQVVQNVFS